MKLASIFNVINGYFFALYGLYGILRPSRVAEFMGFEPSLLGLHQIRAFWMAIFGLGLIIIVASKRLSDQRPLILAIAFIMLCFAFGRILGVWLDGAGPPQTYYELGFEIVWSIVGMVLCRRVSKGADLG